MIENKRILGLICARGGSKGIKRKNLHPLGNRPLIGWSISIAQKCSLIDYLIVSTEDPEIARVARELGADVPFLRPSELAEDHAPEWPVWQHALKQTESQKGFQADYLVVLPPTSPFRAVNDVIKSIEMIHTSDADIIISVTESQRNPYFNMVELGSGGLAELCKPPGKNVTRRQDAPPVYDITTALYTAKTDFILKANRIFDGRVIPLVIPGLRALDIDTALDLQFAEFLLTERLVAPL